MNINLSSILDFSLSNPDNGTLFDMRDGQSYKVVKIGNQIWTAENFRYLPPEEEGGGLCVYDNDYGCFYDWNTAKLIPPEGWKLPSREDFKKLKNFIIKDNNLKPVGIKPVYKSLYPSISRFLRTKGLGTFFGNDKYGFNVKPAGFINTSHYNLNGHVGNLNMHVGHEANFWTDNEEIPVFIEFDSYDNCELELQPHKGDPIKHLFNVRLIKNL